MKNKKNQAGGGGILIQKNYNNNNRYRIQKNILKTSWKIKTEKREFKKLNVFHRDLLYAKVQGSCLCHIHNHTGYNQ